jgi:hypothetical protein
MNEIPDDVYCGSVNLLDAVNAVRGYYETVVGNLRKTPAILAREGDVSNCFSRAAGRKSDWEISHSC